MIDLKLKNEKAMIKLKLYKTAPNKMTEFLDEYSTATIPLKDTSVTINGITYSFKHVVTDNHNIAIVEEKKRRGRMW